MAFIPLEGIQDIPSTNTSEKLHELMGGLLGPLSGRRKIRYILENSQLWVLKVTLYTLDVEIERESEPISKIL